jgi:hypothetical protein
MKKAIAKKCIDKDKSKAARRIKGRGVEKEKGNKREGFGFEIQAYRKENRPEDLHIRATSKLASIVRAMSKKANIEISELVGQMIKYCLGRQKKG